jgi:hypothetical protein
VWPSHRVRVCMVTRCVQHANDVYTFTCSLRYSRKPSVRWARYHSSGGASMRCCRRSCWGYLPSHVSRLRFCILMLMFAWMLTCALMLTCGCVLLAAMLCMILCICVHDYARVYMILCMRVAISIHSSNLIHSSNRRSMRIDVYRQA